MAKFRKKPVVIDAVQFDPFMADCFVVLDASGHVQHTAWSAARAADWLDDNRNIADRIAPAIGTLESPHVADPGDWIITGVKGERYPCKPDIFAATYEAYAPPQPAEEK
jgi:hypothetical protein